MAMDTAARVVAAAWRAGMVGMAEDWRAVAMATCQRPRTFRTIFEATKATAREEAAARATARVEAVARARTREEEEAREGMVEAMEGMMAGMTTIQTATAAAMRLTPMAAAVG